MTQRSILVGKTPEVVIRVGTDVTVKGWDDERLAASTDSRWGLKVEQRSASSIGHVRARVGDRVLLDADLDPLSALKKGDRREITQVEIGASGEVQVPQGSSLKIYAGKSVKVHAIRGSVTIYAGRDVRLRDVQTLIHASAGGAMDLECETLAGDDVKLTAGRDLRLYIRDLTDASIKVNDIGGYWEGTIGSGRRKIWLKAGGDVTLVTNQQVRGEPPHYLLGRIEKPPADDSPIGPGEMREDAGER